MQRARARTNGNSSATDALSTEAPDNPSLEESLDQIERLTAQLEQLTGIASAEASDNSGAGTPSPSHSTDSVKRSTTPTPVSAPRAKFTWCGPRLAQQQSAATTAMLTAKVGSASVVGEMAAPPRRRSRVGAPRSFSAVDEKTLQLPPLPRITSRAASSDAATSAIEPPGSDSPINFGGSGPYEPNREEAPPASAAPPRRRRKKLVFALVAVVLAIPVFALGAIQPWLDSPPTRKGAVAASQKRAEQTGDTGSLANPAVLNGEGSDEGSEASRSGSSRQSGERGSADRRAAPNGASDTQRHTGPVSPLAVNVRASNVEPKVSETVSFTVTWSDGEGQLAGINQDWGDGTPGGGSVNTPGCSTNQLDAGGQQAYRHAFSEPGRYTVRITVTTYTCDGAKETQTVPLTITVAADPSQSPTPQSSSQPPSENPSR